MGLVEANGISVADTRLVLPRIGAWHADLLVALADISSFSGSVSINIDGGALTLKGFAIPELAGGFLDAVLVRVVGGAGGLGKLATPKHYNTIPLRTPLGDLLEAGGESQSSTISADLLGSILNSWVTIGRSVGLGILLLARAMGVDWRVLTDGTVWLGTPGWEKTSADYDIEMEHPNEGRVVLAADAPLVLPGTALADGRHISTVEHEVKGDRVRSTVWWES